MPQMIGVATLGRDAQVRKAGSSSVADLALAFKITRKDSEGNRPTQWVEGSLWGKRAEVLEPYLVKGAQVSVVLDDAHIQTFERRDGTEGYKLVGQVVAIELIGRPSKAVEVESKPAQQPSGFADMDDDLPF